jgi:hypothetical protein
MQTKRVYSADPLFSGVELRLSGELAQVPLTIKRVSDAAYLASQQLDELPESFQANAVLLPPGTLRSGGKTISGGGFIGRTQRHKGRLQVWVNREVPQGTIWYGCITAEVSTEPPLFNLPKDLELI